MLWDIDVDIHQALEREPTPATCPPERTYVPTGLRDRLLTWAHTSLVAGHPAGARFLAWAEYDQNSLCHSSTGLTPFQPALALWTQSQTEAPAVDEWFRPVVPGPLAGAVP